MYGHLLGAWHGASWNFILWGVYFGVILIIEKVFILKLLEKIPAFFSRLYTIILVLISWVIFAFEDLKQIANYLSTMFGFSGSKLVNAETIYYLKNYIIIILIGVICSIPIFKIKDKILNLVKQKRKSLKKNENKRNKAKYAIYVFTSICYVSIILFSTASLVNNSFNPFLYFRF